MGVEIVDWVVPICDTFSSCQQTASISRVFPPEVEYHGFLGFDGDSQFSVWHSKNKGKASVTVCEAGLAPLHMEGRIPLRPRVWNPTERVPPATSDEGVAQLFAFR
jgi:hypothetical protein